MNQKKNTQGRSDPAHLIKILQSGHSEAACRQCLTGLEPYILAQINQSSQDEEFPTIQDHLDSCVECVAAYELLYEAVLAEVAGTLPSPTDIPVPDLSFLKVKTDSLLEKLGSALTATKNSLVLQLDQALYAMLVNAQQTQVGFARSGGNGRYTNKLFQLNSEHLPGDTIPLTVAAFKDNDQDGICLVEVNVEPPGRSWPDLANLAVTLLTKAQKETAVTDEWGTAVFPQVNINYLGSMRLIVSF